MSTIVQALLEAGVSEREISVMLGYSGGNGKRDVAAFLAGKSTNMEDRIAKLNVAYAEWAQKSGSAAPAKKPKEVPAVTSIEQPTKPVAAAQPAVAAPAGIVPRVKTPAVPKAEVAVAPPPPAASYTSPAKPKTAAPTPAPVQAAPIRVVVRNTQPEAPPATPSADTTYEVDPEDDDNANLILSAVPVQGNATSDTKMIEELQNVFTLCAISAAMGFSGKNGKRDIDSFLSGRAKYIDHRRGLLTDFYCVQLGKEQAPLASGVSADASQPQKPASTSKSNDETAAQDLKIVESLRTAGVDDGTISRALGYNGGHGSRDVAAFLEGRSKGLDERREKLVAFHKDVLHNLMMGKGIPTIPAATSDVVKESGLTDAHKIEALRSAGYTDADLSREMGYSGHNGPRDVKTFLEGAPKDKLVRQEKLTLLYNQVFPTPPAVSKEALLSTAEDVIADLRKRGVSDRDISVAMQYSGHNGTRDVEAFLAQKCRDYDKRREALMEFYAATAKPISKLKVSLK